MQDDTANPPSRPARSGRAVLITAVIAFLLGCGLAAWLALSGSLDFAIRPAGDAAVTTQTGGTGVPRAAAPAVDPAAMASAGAAQASAAVGGVETRLALLEERLARLDLQADAASGNAARAEALLVAFAARRMIDKGAPLGYLEDQLKLRFGGAQPGAVKTITDFARDPVTVDQLSAGLDALSPALGESPSQEGLWERVKREFGGLLVVRSASSPAQTPDDRVARAKLMLAAGRTDDAIDEVGHLPGATAARDWITGAKRYAEVQQALDLIETAAMLEPRTLQDSTGTRVEEPSPLGTPTPSPAPAGSKAAGTT